MAENKKKMRFENFQIFWGECFFYYRCMFLRKNNKTKKSGVNIYQHPCQSQGEVTLHTQLYDIFKHLLSFYHRTFSKYMKDIVGYSAIFSLKNKYLTKNFSQASSPLKKILGPLLNPTGNFKFSIKPLHY